MPSCATTNTTSFMTQAMPTRHSRPTRDSEIPRFRDSEGCFRRSLPKPRTLDLTVFVTEDVADGAYSHPRNLRVALCDTGIDQQQIARRLRDALKPIIHRLVKVGVGHERLGRFAVNAPEYCFRIGNDVTQPAASLLDQAFRTAVFRRAGSDVRTLPEAQPQCDRVFQDASSRGSRDQRDARFAPPAVLESPLGQRDLSDVRDDLPAEYRHRRQRRRRLVQPTRIAPHVRLRAPRAAAEVLEAER